MSEDLICWLLILGWFAVAVSLATLAGNFTYSRFKKKGAKVDMNIFVPEELERWRQEITDIQKRNFNSNVVVVNKSAQSYGHWCNGKFHLRHDFNSNGELEITMEDMDTSRTVVIKNDLFNEAMITLFDDFCDMKKKEIKKL